MKIIDEYFFNLIRDHLPEIKEVITNEIVGEICLVCYVFLMKECETTDLTKVDMDQIKKKVIDEFRKTNNE